MHFNVYERQKPSKESHLNDSRKW